MNSRLYTNTSSITAIAGLLVVTVLVAYSTQHADEIVEGTANYIRKGVSKVEGLMHNGKRQVAVIERTYDGTLRDTGKRLWVK